MKQFCQGSLIFLITTSVFAAKQNHLTFNSPTSPWSGAYIGLFAGPAWGKFNTQVATVADGYLTSSSVALVNQAGKQSFHANGFTTGIEAGYNWQKRGYMMGLTIDGQTMNQSSSANSGAIDYPVPPNLAFNIGAFANINWLVTIRPRLGITTPHCLVYATGGLALTQINSHLFFTDENETLVSSSTHSVQPGFVVGGGAEFKLTKNINVKAEYLFVHFGDTNATASGNSLSIAYPNQTFKYSTNFETHMLRVGLNYNFN